MRLFRSKYSKVVTILLAVIGVIFALLNYISYVPQAVVYLLDDTEIPAKNDIVLVFSPHPDDETIGVGGYIIRAIENQSQVYIVLVTDGNKHGLKEKRYSEFKSATETLGVNPNNLLFLNYPDGKLNNVNELELSNKFNEIILEKRPTILIYSDQRDQHSDHAKIGKVLDSMVSNSLYSDLANYTYLVHHSRYPLPKRFNKSLYLLPPPKLITLNPEWTKYMLTGKEEDFKLKALKSYKSQLRVPVLRSLLLSMIRKNELLLSD